MENPNIQITVSVREKRKGLLGKLLPDRRIEISSLEWDNLSNESKENAREFAEHFVEAEESIDEEHPYWKEPIKLYEKKLYESKGITLLEGVFEQEKRKKGYDPSTQMEAILKIYIPESRNKAIEFRYKTY
jgi:hypothetical protein